MWELATGYRCDEGSCADESRPPGPPVAPRETVPVVCAVTTSDPLGARARFLAGIEKASARGDRPARLCEACVMALPVQRAGIAVQVADSVLEILCASDRVAERVEWIQITLGEGPGMHAVATGGPVVVPDLAVMEPRWPMFVPAAIESGIAAMYVMPLQVGAIRVGVLDLYRDTATRFVRSDFADAVAIAELVTTILLTMGQGGWVNGSLGPWWDQPLGTREVHQATGMMMAQLSVSAREAYVRLKAYAYVNGRLLDDVAHAVVHHGLRFDPEADPDPLLPKH